MLTPCIRISVGGAGDQAAKLEKSKKLANRCRIARGAGVWEQTFYRKPDENRPGGEKEGEGEETKAPQKVPDLGDEAFLMGTQISTEVYVLIGDSYIRISVGGASDQAAKLEKSRRLAEFALKRL